MTTPKRTELFTRIAAARQRGLIVVLEDIHDPHNAMAILRTCDAFGIQEIYFIFEQETEFNPNAIGKSSSSSANKWLTFRKFTSTEQCINELKTKKYSICATALSSTAIPLGDVPIETDQLAIVFGNEHRGISETVIQKADWLVQLPMYGFVQSLNVSVTAGIVLYDIVNRRKKLNHDYQLSRSEQQQLVSDFQKR